MVSLAVVARAFASRPLSVSFQSRTLIRHEVLLPDLSSTHQMDDILNGLNAAQKAAVTSTASVLQVLAPPGSGKTKTLTARVAHHISHQHLKPWNIIVCTFTRKAAEQMKERIRSFVGDELAKQLKLGTFHSVSTRYLRPVSYTHLTLPTKRIV